MTDAPAFDERIDALEERLEEHQDTIDKQTFRIDEQRGRTAIGVAGTTAFGDTAGPSNGREVRH